MANITPVQAARYGALYDKTYNNDYLVPGQTPQKPTMSRDDFIAQQVAQNPNSGAAAFARQDAGAKGRGMIRDTISSVTDAAKYLTDPLTNNPAYQEANNSVNGVVNTITRAPYTIGNAINRGMAERQFYDETGQEAPDADTAFNYLNPPEGTPGTPENSRGVLALPDDQKPAMTPADRVQSGTDALTAQLQKNAQDDRQFKANGGVEAPDASTDPVGHLAARNQNQATGVGTREGLPERPKMPVPTASEVQNMQLQQQGAQVAHEQTAIPQWFDSSAFNMGLISFGLNLLSGNDLAQSFNAAGQVFGNLHGQEQRESWRQDLLSQGYAPHEVDAYIQTGDSKLLVDPMERQAKQVQMQTNLQQLNNLQYENSPEMREYTMNRQDALDQLKFRQANAQMANDAARVGIARQGLAMKQAAAQGSGGLPQIYQDTDGTTWEVQRNARGTPIINANGMAYVQNTDTGQVGWRNVSDNQRQMGGIQANEALHAMDQLQNSDLLQYTGNSMVAKGKRRVLDEMGNNITSGLTSNIDNMNGAMRATLETQLMQENNNRPVQKYMLDTAVKRLGKLDIHNSPEENARIMGNYRSVLNSQYHARDETHPSVANRDYSTPQNRPGVMFDGQPTAGQRLPRYGERVNGMTYIGGDPSKQSSWM